MSVLGENSHNWSQQAHSYNCVFAAHKLWVILCNFIKGFAFRIQNYKIDFISTVILLQYDQPNDILIILRMNTAAHYFLPCCHKANHSFTDYCRFCPSVQNYNWLVAVKYLPFVLCHQIKSVYSINDTKLEALKSV